MSFLIRTAVFVRFFMLCTPPGIQVARLPKACYNTEAGATSGIRILLLVTARRYIVPLPGTLFLTGCAKLQNSLYYKRSGGCSPVLCMIPPTFLLTGLSGWQRPPRLGTAEGAFVLPSESQRLIRDRQTAVLQNLKLLFISAKRFWFGHVETSS